MKTSAARKPVVVEQTRKESRDHSDLMYEMGSPDGHWNPEPDDHITGVLREDVKLSPNEIKAIFYTKQCCVRPKCGGRTAWGKTADGRPLIEARFKDFFGWDDSNTSKYLERPLAYGFIRKNPEGVFGLGARVDGVCTDKRTSGEENDDPVCTYRIPEYLITDYKRLSEPKQKEFIQGWVAIKTKAKQKLNAVTADCRREEHEELSGFCGGFGMQLKGGDKRREKNAPATGETRYVHTGSVQTGKTALYTESAQSAQTAHIRSSEFSSEKELASAGGERTKPKAPEDDELTFAIEDALQRSRLETLGDPPKRIDARTVGILRSHLGRIADQPRTVKQILEIVEEKCRFLRERPSEAATKTWGWVVGIVKSEVAQRLEASGAAPATPEEAAQPFDVEEFNAQMAELVGKKVMR